MQGVYCPGDVHWALGGLGTGQLNRRKRREEETLNNIVTLKSGLEVTQGH